MSEPGKAPAQDPLRAGERGQAVVSAHASPQVRMVRTLSLLLMAVLGVGAIAEYYAHLAHRRAPPAAPTRTAPADAPLPALPRIEPAPAVAVPAMAQGIGDGPTHADARGQTLPVVDGPLPSAPRTAPVTAAPTGSCMGSACPAPDRRLGGAIFSAPETAGDVGHAASLPGAGAPSSIPRGSRPAELAQWLDGVGGTPPRRADRRWLLARGTAIDCTLETAIDSSLPGLTTCVTASDTRGEDGAVVLLARGTRLVGETRGQVQQGSARVFVLWTEARTPQGVLVPLDSPGTDELGRAGVGGEVDWHFWQRFGAALLVSSIGALGQAAMENLHGGNGIIVDTNGPQTVAAEIVKHGTELAPTVRVANGTAVRVLVAHDIDLAAQLGGGASTSGSPP